ncbi:unnamed protein product [Nyctereutes procyonoides]|uniref:Dolichyl-diphosphooligosaccharide--protein glycosyltransferase subunit TMEM258 n=1 Tax=Nyctereutes procyonoides TaxID=34880 RepID=A0A811ZRG1_NYCPR|nr:unnamed protein product [Nyctereutes procyonoides]
MKPEAMSRYISPANLAAFPHLTMVLLAIELLISLVAWLFMDFGVLFLLPWVSIYI